MATRSVISKIDKKASNGEITAVYCHSDGYLKHTGKILNEHYNSEDKVDELLSYGDASIIMENIGEKLDFNDYKTFAEKKQCRFYMRDRGEKNKEVTKLKNEDELLEYGFSNMGVEYIYMYAYGHWYVCDYEFNSKLFIELEEALYV